MFRHLLVPTDGSTLSEQTVDRAVSFAREGGARITFLYVQPEVFGPGNVALYGDGVVINPGWNEEIVRSNKVFAAHVLEEARAKAEAGGSAKAETHGSVALGVVVA